MKTKAKSIEECTTLFEIEVPQEDIGKAFDDAYTEFVKVANIPGFRIGKAPREMVKKQYAKEAKSEVLNNLIPEAYNKAVEEHKIAPISLPEISDVVFEDGKPLTFKARVDTRPKFKLKNYKGLALQKKKAVVKESDIDKALTNLKEFNARYVAVEDRPIQLGDYVVSDLDCYVDGKPIHKKRENLWLYIDKESLMCDLTEKMVGMKKLEERDIDARLPEKYPNADLAGKEARYHVVVKEIKVRNLPSLDDEFAKDLGRENLVQLKEEVVRELEAKMKADSEIALENQLLGKLIDDNVFAVPSSVVHKQLHLMVEDAKARLVEKGFQKSELDKKQNEFEERFKNDAVRQVRLLFILNSIAQAEHIDTDEKDLDEAYKTMAAQAGRSETEVRSYYKEHGLVDNLADRLREAKAISFLLKEAKVTEVE